MLLYTTITDNVGNEIGSSTVQATWNLYNMIRIHCISVFILYDILLILIVGAEVVRYKILSDIMITILCSVLVFQSTVVVIQCGYAIYIQPVGTAAATTTIVPMEMKLSTVAKMLVDKAIQEFQSNNINNTITYLQGAEQELSSSLAIAGNNRNNNSASISTALLTILLLVKSSIQALDNLDYGKGQGYLNLLEQELGRI